MNVSRNKNILEILSKREIQGYLGRFSILLYTGGQEETQFAIHFLFLFFFLQFLSMQGTFLVVFKRVQLTCHTHVCLFCLYGGREPWSLPIFFALRKCAAGQMENWEKLNRPRANRYMAHSFFHILHNQPSRLGSQHVKITVDMSYFFVSMTEISSMAVQQPLKEINSTILSDHRRTGSPYRGEQIIRRLSLCEENTLQNSYRSERMDQSCYDELGWEERSKTRNNRLSLRELKTVIMYSCNCFDITNNTMIHKRNSRVFLFKAHCLKFNLVTWKKNLLANSDLNNKHLTHSSNQFWTLYTNIF